jgi:energy-coupling factor transporter ATP-binding protein EcfA2
MNVVEASGLGKRYGGTWALRGCTLAVPAGHVAALVGPNGAGKTTLLNLAAGLAAPSAGIVTVLGGRPPGSPAALDGIAFVAQDMPLYKNLSAADMLHLTRNLNRRFDQHYAQARLAELGIPLKRKAGKPGTFRYAWTQGIGRWRWTIAKLVPLAVVVAAAAGALSVLFSWYYLPYFAAGNQNLGLNEVSPFFPGLFDLRGVAFAAWTLAAFAIGALAGMLIRRVVPAIVATLAAYAGLAFAAGLFLRQRYLTPLVTTRLNVPGSAWITAQWWTKDGTFAFAGPPPDNLLRQLCPPSSFGPGKPSAVSIVQCVAQHGYTQWTSYQPASRFWPFQWIEGGWLLALSVLLIAATVWLVRRRAA